MRKGFTMIEVLISFAIIAVLASILVSHYSRTKAKADQRQAESYLRAVRISQKMYYARNGAYYTTTCANAAAIKAALGTEIKDRSYTFSMASTDVTHFTATADTTGTANDLTLTEAGAWTKGGSPYAPP